MKARNLIFLGKAVNEIVAQCYQDIHCLFLFEGEWWGGFKGEFNIFFLLLFDHRASAVLLCSWQVRQL